MYNFFNKLVILPLISLTFFLISANRIKPQIINGIFGYYDGAITIEELGQKKEIPLTVRLSRTDITNDRIKKLPTKLFDYQDQILGSFVIDNAIEDNEFGRVDFDLETGELNLLFFRSGSSSPSLRFEGQLGPHGEIQGKILSNIGEKPINGKFKLERTKNSTFLTEDKYSGPAEKPALWKGVFTFADGEKTPMELSLTLQEQTVSDPANWELDYTRARRGFFNLNTTIEDAKYNVSTMVIDHLRREFVINAFPISGVVMTLEGRFDAVRQELIGTAISKSPIGSFELRRVQ